MKVSLSITYAGIAAEWHPKKNGTLTPEQVTAGSNKKVWWQCSKDSSHEWSAVIANRSKGSGCPLCSKRKASSTTSLQTLFPALAAQWHQEKNGGLTPDQVRPGSAKVVWWRCPVNRQHEWEAA